MSAATNTETLRLRLASSTPDLDAIIAALVIVAAALRRLPSRDSPRVTVARRDGRRLTLFPQYLVHETATDEWIVVDAKKHPPVMKATWTVDGSTVVDEVDPDGEEETSTFEWGWREVADGLAAALRALPSRTRPPKAVRCPHCRKEFVP